MRPQERYGDKTAVDGLSFVVEPGVVTGFLGPNGAWKSTMMRVIAGLDRPTSGTVRVNGKRYPHAAAQADDDDDGHVQRLADHGPQHARVSQRDRRTSALPHTITGFAPHLPSNAGGALCGNPLTTTHALSPWTGFAVLCGYAITAITAAAWRLRRRDA